MDFLKKLVDKGLVKEDKLVSLQKQARDSDKSIEDFLQEMGISAQQILEAKGEAKDMPTRSLKSKIPYKILKYIPKDSAEYYKVAPLGVKDGVLQVGIVDPDNMEARDALNFISSKIGMPFKLFLITSQDFEKVLKMYEGLSGKVSEALSSLEEVGGEEIVEEVAPEEPEEEEEAEIENLEKKGASGKEGEEPEAEIEEEAPITKVVATILRYAVEGKASDVHIELMTDKLRVRFRVDGVLNTSLVLPAKVHDKVVSRIKVLSSMRLDVKRKPQDGRFSATFEGRKIDFRVSTFPAYYGEKVVMRILDRERGVKSLEDTGFSQEDLETLRRAFRQPYGILLISGPTGSGKSTTLYGILQEFDRTSQNVVSLEDPVEYNIEGVSQAEMRPEIGFTFANGLRTTLRQDPDIIMVGEIRDKETANLAMRAALTGHLVLTTIHTNNAAGVIPRLVDMGIDPYLIAPTLVAAVAQRLVSKICPDTGKKKPVEGSLRRMVEEQFEDLPEEYRQELPEFDYVYEKEPGPGCPVGTRGRTGVFEILEMNKDMEQAILNNPVASEFKKTARKHGMLTMKEDALIKSTQGIVPFEEVNKLGGEF